MDIRELGRLDLNLLVALEALIEEGSVSRAAERLYITQSAMSKTLGRLRELFDDPLFIRRGSGMVPTPRAASGEEPRRAMKAVSTNPVKGSATRENRTGIERVTNVLWGAFANGWSTDVSGLDSKRSVQSSPKK